MKMDELLMEIKADEIVKNWNKLYNAYVKVKGLPVKDQIKEIIPLLPGGVEDESGKIMQIADVLPTLKNMLREKHIRLDQNAQGLLRLISYLSTSTSAAQEAGFKNVQQAFSI